MRYSQAGLSLRPLSEGESAHQRLLSAGAIRQTGAGLWAFLPLGASALRLTEQAIRLAMQEAGGVEISLPSLQAQSLWTESGRLEDYGAEMFRLEN